ncbi:DUF4326 domain-containing protein [Micromonospora sp. NPDC005298]|uniref:DUF4326 domain-containing protein n=1 Tax=Micromonospora sp. NPDC005298 TaxID=3156873 RepID=UPI0033A7DD8C
MTPEGKRSAGQSGTARSSGAGVERRALPDVGRRASGTTGRALPGVEVPAGHRAAARVPGMASGTASRALPELPADWTARVEQLTLDLGSLTEARWRHIARLRRDFLGDDAGGDEAEQEADRVRTRSDTRCRPGARVRVAGDLYHGRVPDGAVYVGRGAPGLPGSRYANRHRAGHCRVCRVEHDRAGAVAAYARELEERPELVDAARRELAGADLACWCRVDGQPCHGDVLALVVAGLSPRAAAGAVLS